MLKLSNIDVYYGAMQALDSISFEVAEGEVVTLVGSNGAGKSTILRTISGILHPAAGKIEFKGINIGKLPPNKIVRLGISHVPEGRQLFPEMTVSENLEMGSICCEDPSEVQSNLDLVYELFPVLRERSKQDAGSLSGGQQQMLAVGRGLMSGAKFQLLDEPSLGLAPVLVDTLFETIGRLPQIGFTLLLVEQNVYAALSVAQRVHVIATGQILFSGTPAEILASEKLREAYLGEVSQE